MFGIYDIDDAQSITLPSGMIGDSLFYFMLYTAIGMAAMFLIMLFFAIKKAQTFLEPLTAISQYAIEKDQKSIKEMKQFDKDKYKDKDKEKEKEKEKDAKLLNKLKDVLLFDFLKMVATILKRFSSKN